MKVYTQNPLHSERSFIAPRIAPIEKMRFVRMENDSIRVISDTSLLANSERIINMIGVNAYNMMLSNMRPTKSNYSGDRFTDEQLFHQIKSRYVQSPSEMRAWIDNLMAEGDSIISESNRLKEEALKKAAEVAAQQSQTSGSSE